jgi:soluble P-type ATPase
MAIDIDIPGVRKIRLEHLLLDQNGTLSDRGELIDGVAERLRKLGERLAVYILTADTFGTLDEITSELRIGGERVRTGADKLAFLDRLGPQHCAAVGNGRNDVPMLQAAALGITVLGPEGAASVAIAAADLVCRSITEALDLLMEPITVAAGLRI